MHGAAQVGGCVGDRPFTFAARDASVYDAGPLEKPPGRVAEVR